MHLQQFSLDQYGSHTFYHFSISYTWYVLLIYLNFALSTALKRRAKHFCIACVAWHTHGDHVVRRRRRRHIFVFAQ